jgi:hypothetical protein
VPSEPRRLQSLQPALTPPPPPRSRYSSAEACPAIVNFLVPPEMCAAWSTSRGGLVFGASGCQLEMEAAADAPVVDIVTYRYH